MVYILKNARRIDFLCTYHIKERTLISILIYHICNPKGKVWLDIDMNLLSADFLAKMKVGTLLQRLNFAIQRQIMRRCCTLISSPSTKSCARISEIYGCNIQHIPLGYDMPYVKSDKDNIILSVGRLGTKQKNIELLVNAFVNTSEMHNWKLVLAGPAEKEFLVFLRKITEKYGLQDRIEYVGNVSERERLSELYAKAKIFVLPSRWESFGIVLVEALSEGDYLIGSDAIEAWEDITRGDKRIGACFKNNRISSLEQCILETINSPYLKEEYMLMRSKYAIENYSYKNIVKKVKRHL